MSIASCEWIDRQHLVFDTPLCEATVDEMQDDRVVCRSRCVPQELVGAVGSFHIPVYMYVYMHGSARDTVKIPNHKDSTSDSDGAR